VVYTKEKAEGGRIERECGNMKNEDTELLQVLVAEHLKQLQKKQTFEVAAKALTALVQERYAGASPAEQNAVCFPFSRGFLVTALWLL